MLIGKGETMDGQTIELLAGMICGDDQEKLPVYRPGSELTSFFDSSDPNALATIYKIGHYK